MGVTAYLTYALLDLHVRPERDPGLADASSFEKDGRTDSCWPCLALLPCPAMLTS